MRLDLEMVYSTWNAVVYSADVSPWMLEGHLCANASNLMACGKVAEKSTLPPAFSRPWKLVTSAKNEVPFLPTY